jgi:hypothetical protein
MGDHRGKWMKKYVFYGGFLYLGLKVDINKLLSVFWNSYCY